MVLYAMLYGTVPFKGGDMNELHQLIKDGRYTMKDSISQDARNLIKEILNIDPGRRISLRKILEHPWM